MSHACWRDPWPSPQPDWHDPPWRMRGRAVTAWFELPWDVAKVVLSPDVLPAPVPSLRSRLRFYRMEFQPLRPRPGRYLELREGEFREGVIGIPARGPGVEGEISAFLWTDSEDYLIWGREAFGWPVRLAEIGLDGDLWSAAPGIGRTGSARVTDRWGTAALVGVELTDPASSGTPGGVWLTPRRLLLHGQDGPRDERQLLAVRPEVRKPGSAYAARGRVTFDFSQPHPLAGLGAHEAQVEFVDDFELVVGRNVSPVSFSERDGVTVSDSEGVV